MSEPDRPKAGRSRRDPRLDVFRGLALVMIYVNHVPGTVYENFTSRNFGLSDAAEAFVLMSGVAAGLAYSPAFRQSPYWPGVAKVWGRAWTLYLVHMLTTLWALAIAAAAALWFGAMSRLYVNEMQMLFEQPLAFLIGLPLLTHQLGYINILPMYAVLLMAAPAMLWLAPRRPWLLMALSVLFWALTGLNEWNLPNYPNHGGWFFNPLAWQVIFVVGLITGTMMREGRRFIPIRRGLQWLAGVILLLGLAWAWVTPLRDAFNHAMWLASEAGAPRFLTMTDKTYVTWPRLLHILALGYLLSSLGWVRGAAASKAASPIAMLGRHALPVFALGSLLSLVGQAIKSIAPASFALDTAIIFGGLFLQYALAWARDRYGLKGRE